MARVDAIFKLVKDRGASDLHLTSGSPPMLRIDGNIEAIEYQPLEPALLSDLLKEMMTPEQWASYESEGEVDFAYEVVDVARVRCNVFEQRKGIAGSFRILPNQIYSLEQLGLPESLTRFTELTKGLVVVTGPPGSGKSSTLAALIDHLNRHQRRHVLTIEDPIEYVHENKLSLINQREVGHHTKSFATALKAALREDPNIILVGEMRDLETISLAVTAAETGQLVFGSLHTAAAAAQTVERLIDVFDGAKQEHIRTLLSESLRGVIAQRLPQRAEGGGRVPAVEILVGTPALRALIRERKTHQIPSLMQTGRREGMVMMDDYLASLVSAGHITVDEAEKHALRKETIRSLGERPERAA